MTGSNNVDQWTGHHYNLYTYLHELLRQSSAILLLTTTAKNAMAIIAVQQTVYSRRFNSRNVLGFALRTYTSIYIYTQLDLTFVSLRHVHPTINVDEFLVFFVSYTLFYWPHLYGAIGFFIVLLWYITEYLTIFWLFIRALDAIGTFNVRVKYWLDYNIIGYVIFSIVLFVIFSFSFGRRDNVLTNSNIYFKIKFSISLTLLNCIFLTYFFK